MNPLTQKQVNLMNKEQIELIDELIILNIQYFLTKMFGGKDVWDLEREMEEVKEKILNY